MFTISSRTPEGSPNRCPICQGDVRIESSLPFGHAPCPNCGCLLWFLGLSTEQRLLFEYEAAEELRELLLRRAAEQLGVSKHKLEAEPWLLKGVEFDSLDIVELVLNLEETRGSNF